MLTPRERTLEHVHQRHLSNFCPSVDIKVRLAGYKLSFDLKLHEMFFSSFIPDTEGPIGLNCMPEGDLGNPSYPPNLKITLNIYKNISLDFGIHDYFARGSLKERKGSKF